MNLLVVVDMQNDFIDGALGTKEAREIIDLVVEKIKLYQKANNPIYFTKDTHEAAYLATQEGKNLPVEHCIKGTSGWELGPQIQELVETLQQQNFKSIIFEKGVFGSKELAQVISDSVKDSDDVTIELVGLCTDICVLANAIVLKTYMPEAVITVDASCCAGVTKESHINALNAMKMCQIKVINE